MHLSPAPPGGALILRMRLARPAWSLRSRHSLYKQVTFKCLGYKLRPCRLPWKECKHSTVVGANSETDFIIYSRPRVTQNKGQKGGGDGENTLFKCKYDNAETCLTL